MKKILAIVLAAAMCMSFAACGGAGSTGAAETTAVETTAVETTAFETTAFETTAFETTAVETTAAETTVYETAAVTGAVESTHTTLEDAVASVEALLNVLKSGDDDALLAFASNSADDMDEMTLNILKAMFAKLDYSFAAPVDAGDGTATVEAEITSIDINAVLMTYIFEAAKHTEDEEVWDADNSILFEMMSGEDAATVTSSVTLNFEEVDGSWILSDNNDDFVSALYGGLV